MRRTPIVIATAVAILTAVTPGVASAGDQYTCPTGYFCIWKDSSFNSSRFDSLYDRNSQSGLNVGDNQASSGFNRTTHTTKLWEHLDCIGTLNTTFTAGSARASFTNNDKSSSIDHYNQSVCP